MFKKLFGKKDYENPDIVEMEEEIFEDNSFEAKEEIHGKIAKDTMIGDIVEKYPEVIETLTELGVHCVGCHVSPFESLEMGFKGHGMSDEDIENAIIKLNDVIEKAKNEIKKGDLEFEEKGVKVFIEMESFDKLKGSYIDYLDTLQGAGFKIKNPNATSTCGCGESFG